MLKWDQERTTQFRGENFSDVTVNGGVNSVEEFYSAEVTL